MFMFIMLHRKCSGSHEKTFDWTTGLANENLENPANCR